MYLTEVPEKEIWDIININVGAVTMMTKIALNQMKPRGKGAIVNVSSGSELQPLPLMTVYGATKVKIYLLSHNETSNSASFPISDVHKKLHGGHQTRIRQIWNISATSIAPVRFDENEFVFG